MTESLFTYYQNFTFDNPTITLTVIMIAMYGALLSACFAVIYNKIYLGSLVRVLSKEQCFDASKALSFDELGIKPSAVFRRALSPSKTLGKYVKVANPEECTAVKPRKCIALRRFLSMETGEREVYDLTKALVYIPEEKHFTAEIRYASKAKKGTVIVSVIATAVLGAVLCAVLMFFIPEILGLWDDFITYVKSLIGE